MGTLQPAGVDGADAGVVGAGLQLVGLLVLEGMLVLDVERGQPGVVAVRAEGEAQLELERLDLVVAVLVRLLLDLEARLEREVARDAVLVLELSAIVAVARVEERAQLELVRPGRAGASRGSG